VSLLHLGLTASSAADTVGGIPFEFDAVLVGEASLDLNHVIDTVVYDADQNRIPDTRRRSQPSLDARSRRPLS